MNIALDFDGVIHAATSDWQNTHVIPDDPVPGAFAFIRTAIDEGHNVFIHTARANTATSVPQIYAWLAKHGLEEKYYWQIQISALKPGADIYIDDLGWRFDGTFPSLGFLGQLTSWNRPGGKLMP